MLIKKLKYDLESVFKVIAVFYGLALFFGLITRLFLDVEDSFIIKVIGQVSMFTFVLLLVGIIIVSILRLWMRFRSDFYGDESYLTHTLPIEKNTLLLSKALTAVILLFTSIVVIVLLLLMTFYSKENVEFFRQMIIPLVKGNNSTVIKVLLTLVFILFLEFLGTTFVGYTGIILGHRMDNSKIAFSVRFGFITYVMAQIFIVLCMFIAALLNKDIMKLFHTSEVVNIDMVHLISGLAIIIYSLLIVILYLIDMKLFKKGVNVE